MKIKLKTLKATVCCQSRTKTECRRCLLLGMQLQKLLVGVYRSNEKLNDAPRRMPASAAAVSAVSAATAAVSHMPLNGFLMRRLDVQSLEAIGAWPWTAGAPMVKRGLLSGQSDGVRNRLEWEVISTAIRRKSPLHGARPTTTTSGRPRIYLIASKLTSRWIEQIADSTITPLCIRSRRSLTVRR